MSGRGKAVYAVLRHVRPIVLNSARVVEAEVRGIGWTVGMRSVMEVLAELGSATVPQLGMVLDLPRQGVQRHVDALLDLGHVRTTANPRHRRSVLIQPTDTGSRAFATMRSRELEQLAGLAAECSDADLATAQRVLAALEREIHDRAHHPPAHQPRAHQPKKGADR